MSETNIPRRKWLKWTFGIAAGTAGSAFTFYRLDPKDKDCALTPQQELGPFPPMKSRSQPDHDVDLTRVKGQDAVATGEIIMVKGKILDDQCKAVEGAVVEIWQSNHHGKYHHEYDKNGTHDPNFQGWGQAITNKDGSYQFKTIIPGLYTGRTRHIHFKIARRGYHELVTQMYFDGEEGNSKDGLLNALTHEEQQKVIRKIDRTKKVPEMIFDINIMAVDQAGIPQKVLAEYVGKYDLHHKGTKYEGMIKELYGAFDKIVVEIGYEGRQLYFTLPFAPKSEAPWKEKDLFAASQFYLADLGFIRNADGKVNELAFKWKDGPDLKGTKI